MRVTEQQQRAFEALRNGDVQTVLKTELAEVQDTLVKTIDGTTVRILQGRARQLMDILSTIDGTSRQIATPGKRP